jgi:SAM-dependent methyltransferase
MKHDPGPALRAFLSRTERSAEGYLQISPHRKFEHDEHAYDAQYRIEPQDMVLGEGLFRLAQQLGVDTQGYLLELGCGTGRLSVGLPRFFDANRVIVTDGSSTFVDLTRRKFEGNGLALPYLGVLQFDDLGKLPDGVFSMLVMTSTLHHVNEYREFIATAAQKLAPGGCIVVQEPLFEGLFLMGLIAKSLLRQAPDDEIRRDLALLSDTMEFYCRNDVDKSSAEDKYAFRLSDILAAANTAGLGLRYFPNHTLGHFATGWTGFSYASFARDYLVHCMSFGPKTVDFYLHGGADAFEFIRRVSGLDRAPESVGVFALLKPR